MFVVCATLAAMPSYEITLMYPDQPLDRTARAFLGSIIATPQPVLDGFRSSGRGVALTFVVENVPDPEAACRLASQRAGGIWPNFHPSLTHSAPIEREIAPSL
jgi:hypothetical protein